MTKNSKFFEKSEELAKSEKKVQDFKHILENIDNLDDKCKSLWIEVYENSVLDRERASMLYTDLYKDIKGSPEKHGLYGMQMSKYLERMCKSNDQIIRLAEIIERVQRQEDKVDPNDILESIARETGN